MTRKRLLTLGSGVVVLGALTYFKLTTDQGPPEVVAWSPPPPPPLPAAPPSVDPASVEKAPAQVGAVLKFGGESMGTTYHVKYVVPFKEVETLAAPRVAIALEEVNEAMSTYLPQSQISVFNAAAADQLVPLSPDVLTVLNLSKQVSQDTKGAFDITVRPLVRAFGFGSDAAETPPTHEELQALRKKVGMKHVHIEATGAKKDLDGVELDLSAVAKGFGVDQAARALEDLKIESYMVEVGGEIRVKGEKAPGAPWVLAIEEPVVGGSRIHGTLSLPDGGALATSGDYRNFQRIGDELISHTFDPRSGKPAPRRTASVSVVRPTAAEADALATAFGVLTPKESIALANQKNWAVYLLVHDGQGGFKPEMSRAFKALGMTLTGPDALAK